MEWQCPNILEQTNMGKHHASRSCWTIIRRPTVGCRECGTPKNTAEFDVRQEESFEDWRFGAFTCEYNAVLCF